MYKLNWGEVNEINRKFELIISFSLCNFAMVSVIVDRQGKIKKEVVYIHYIWWNHVTCPLLSFNNQSINLFGYSVFKKITVNDITWSWNNHTTSSGSNLLCQFRDLQTTYYYCDKIHSLTFQFMFIPERRNIQT